MVKYLEANGNENTTSRKLWDEIKVGLTGKFMAISTYIKKKTLNSTTNFTPYLKKITRNSKPTQVKKSQARAEVSKTEKRKTKSTKPKARSLKRL